MRFLAVDVLVDFRAVERFAGDRLAVDREGLFAFAALLDFAGRALVAVRPVVFFLVVDFFTITLLQLSPPQHCS